MLCPCAGAPILLRLALTMQPNKCFTPNLDAINLVRELEIQLGEDEIYLRSNLVRLNVDLDRGHIVELHTILLDERLLWISIGNNLDRHYITPV